MEDKKTDDGGVMKQTDGEPVKTESVTPLGNPPPGHEEIVGVIDPEIHNPNYEQLVLELGRVQEINPNSRLAEEERQDGGKKSEQESSPAPQSSITPTYQQASNDVLFGGTGQQDNAADKEEASHHVAQEELFKSGWHRGLAEEKTGGEIALNYTFERFNAQGEYAELRISSLSPSRLMEWRNEAVFEHKGDGSRITIRKDKIICDNTDRNIQAALDIAQDKGWDVIKITGGSKSSKAEMWFHAQMRGLETRGYDPSEADKKRLLGAQERERKSAEAQEQRQGDALTHDLDIVPKQEAQSAQNIADKGDDASQGKGKSEQPRAGKGETVQPATKQSEDTLSRDQLFDRQRKEIMAEIEKVMPLDRSEYQDIQKAITEQLAAAYKAGKSLNMKDFKEGIRSGLPIVREGLEAAASREIRKENEAHQLRESQPRQQQRQSDRER